jgi:hypothetical protein
MVYSIVRTIEKRIMKKIKDYLTKNVPDPGSEVQEKITSNPDPGFRG